MSVGAPYSFEGINFIVSVFVVRVYQIYQNFFFCVGKGAEISVFAHAWILSKVLAKFSFIACWMIKLLDLVVRSFAVAVGLGTWYMGIVLEIRSASIFFIMKSKTNLSIVMI